MLLANTLLPCKASLKQFHIASDILGLLLISVSLWEWPCIIILLSSWPLTIAAPADSPSHPSALNISIGNLTIPSISLKSVVKKLRELLPKDTSYHDRSSTRLSARKTYPSSQSARDRPMLALCSRYWARWERSVQGRSLRRWKPSYQSFGLAHSDNWETVVLRVRRIREQYRDVYIPASEDRCRAVPSGNGVG